MSGVKASQSIAVDFTTENPTTGALQNAGSTPTGTLVINGTDDAATVTINNKATGKYKAAFTVPAGVAVGDLLQLRIDATVASVTGAGYVWADSVISKRVSELNDASASGTATSVWANAGRTLTSGANIVLAKGVGITGFNDLDAAGIRSAMGVASANLDTVLAAIQNSINNLTNLSSLANLFGPFAMEIPESGSLVFPFTLTVKDSEGKLVDLDSSPTVSATNAAGTDRSGNLSSVSHPSTGVYTFSYTVEDGDAEEGIRVSASGAVSAEARRADFVSTVVNYDSVSLLNAIFTKVDALPADPAGVSDIPTAEEIEAEVSAGIEADHGSGLYTRNTEPPSAATITAAVAAQITTDHGNGSYLRNTEPNNTDITAVKDLLEADLYIDKGTTPWKAVYIKKGSGNLATGEKLRELILKDVDGGNLSSTDTVIGQAVAA